MTAAESTYTPTATEVRALWCAWANYGGLTDRPYDSTDLDEMGDEFDRWLAEHDAQVRGEARDALRRLRGGDIEQEYIDQVAGGGGER